MREDDGDDRPKRPVRHEIGQDLSSLSLHELAERVTALQAEIRRLEDEARRKAASRDTAAAFFKS